MRVVSEGKESYYKERAIIAVSRRDYMKAIQFLVKAIVESERVNDNNQ